MTETVARSIGSLFSGIGGLELGLERAGLGRVAWQVEADPYCRSTLARHWPDALRFDDVRSVSGDGYGQTRLDAVDILCGGYPCQDVSAIGKRAGLDGARSGLWYEMARLVTELLPTWVVVENTDHGHAIWLPDVRRSLHGIGYASVPIRVRACDVGLPHRRARVFVVANRQRERLERLVQTGATTGATLGARDGETYTGALRVPDGVPTRMVRDAIHAYGNAVVPACAEMIGRLILNAQDAA